jgi:cellulose synthase/poly-beta-1,6-N-acetylglucosamine synthase-like glycosyltransferase
VVSRRPRPPVTVIVPFRGDRAAAESLLETLGLLRTRPEDQLIVADNTPGGVVAEGGAAGVEVVRVPAPPSARRARNEGARRAANPWLLFLDADCRPDPALLDEYFSSKPAECCGVIAGEVIGDRSQAEMLARWARSRRGLMARYHVESGGRPAGIAGNLMLRREAWADAGGFEEGARSEADIDLCWRVQAAGWSLEYRPEAAVAHRHPTGLRDVLRQAWMYGLGKRWLRDRWGSAADPPRVAVPLARAIGGAAVWTLRGRIERAVFKLVDGLVAGAGWLGYQAARTANFRR